MLAEDVLYITVTCGSGTELAMARVAWVARIPGGTSFTPHCELQ